ncbi:MAG: hypothetical protein ACLFR0_04145 [Alphaproteobacteria bacterium]
MGINLREIWLNDAMLTFEKVKAELDSGEENPMGRSLVIEYLKSCGLRRNKWADALCVEESEFNRVMGFDN